VEFVCYLRKCVLVRQLEHFSKPIWRNNETESFNNLCICLHCLRALFHKIGVNVRLVLLVIPFKFVRFGLERPSVGGHSPDKIGAVAAYGSLYL